MPLNRTPSNNYLPYPYSNLFGDSMTYDYFSDGLDGDATTWLLDYDTCQFRTQFKINQANGSSPNANVICGTLPSQMFPFNLKAPPEKSVAVKVEYGDVVGVSNMLVWSGQPGDSGYGWNTEANCDKGSSIDASIT